MGSAPDAPDPPDTIGAAREQGRQNRATAVTQYQLGATTQRTPFGSLEYRQVGTWPDGTPRFEAVQSLSPEQQQIYNAQTQRQLGLYGLGEMSLSGAPALRSGYNTDFSADRRRVEEAMLGRLNEQLGQDRKSLEQQLANQGIAPGSEAYRNAMDEFARREQEARTSAILGAGAEQSRLADLAHREAAFGNQARAQYVDEQFALRNQPFNELNALRGGGQLNQPNFANTPQPGVAPTDILGATQMQYQNQLAQYGADVGQYQSNMAGLYGLGAAGIMALAL
jgi:hypothetical protein